MKIAANRFIKCVLVMPGSVAAEAERRLGIRSGTPEATQTYHVDEGFRAVLRMT
jgi:hypothetical protein